jgi:phosphatidylinositol 4-phosphatase
VLDESRKIYVVKDVTAIPLNGVQEATSVTSTIARSNAVKARSSLLVGPSREPPSDDAGLPGEAGNRVKFADGHEVKVMSPMTADGFSTFDRPPSPASVASSVVSSASSEFAAAPVAKVLASRLSFWNRVPRKNSIGAAAIESRPVSEEIQPLDALIHEDMPLPHQVMSEIIETAAPPPATIKEKYTELEAKILRQTIKEFSKGEMYFAYDFGKAMRVYCIAVVPLINVVPDITRSLQHKQEQIAKAERQSVLLAELNALDPSAMSVTHSENINFLAEPLPNLPLWRRVDRQFWWNEHLSKPFIEAGVLFHPRSTTLTHSQLTSYIHMYCHLCKVSSRSPRFRFRKTLASRHLETPLTWSTSYCPGALGTGLAFGISVGVWTMKRMQPILLRQKLSLGWTYVTPERSSTY